MSSLKEIEIDGQKSFDGHIFPLVLTPNEDFFDASNPLEANFVQNLNEIKEKLLQHGAILFRL
jgi:hypothetical protein